VTVDLLSYKKRAVTAAVLKILRGQPLKEVVIQIITPVKLKDANVALIKPI
tara:strand:+ start:240 stop:392 length:153 start_codon:yes stop_codon:yes gene_type:complete